MSTLSLLRPESRAAATRQKTEGGERSSRLWLRYLVASKSDIPELSAVAAERENVERNVHGVHPR